MFSKLYLYAHTGQRGMKILLKFLAKAGTVGPPGTLDVLKKSRIFLYGSTQLDEARRMEYFLFIYRQLLY